MTTIDDAQDRPMTSPALRLPVLLHNIPPVPAHNHGECGGDHGAADSLAALAADGWEVRAGRGRPIDTERMQVLEDLVNAGERAIAAGITGDEPELAPVMAAAEEALALEAASAGLTEAELAEALRAYEQDLTIGSGASIRGIVILVDADRAATLLTGRPR